MRKLILPLLLVAGMIPLASHAVCNKAGHIERVTAYNDGIATYHYIYLRTSALSNTVWSVRTNDDEMAGIAATALTSTTRVHVQGDAAACPANGYFGNLRFLIVNP
jgi:hypothetical protein